MWKTNGGPSNYQTPREAGVLRGPMFNISWVSSWAQWRGSGRRSTPGQEEPWRGWRRRGEHMILFQTLTPVFPIFDFHFLDNSATSDDFNCVRHYLCQLLMRSLWLDSAPTNIFQHFMIQISCCKTTNTTPTRDCLVVSGWQLKTKC